MISVSEGLEMMYGGKKMINDDTSSGNHSPGCPCSTCGEQTAKDLKDTHMINSLSDRPDWDTWFMTLCFVVSQRSLDKDTKHGCVVADDSNAILSVGYNSPPRGCVDEYVPLERPAKYDYMEHSEENAIVNAARIGTCLKGAIFYITGPPCHRCFAKMLNVGASKIIHGPTPSAMLNSNTEKVIAFMKMNQKIEVVELKDVNSVYALLSKTEGYINTKMGDGNETQNASANS